MGMEMEGGGGHTVIPVEVSRILYRPYRSIRRIQFGVYQKVPIGSPSRLVVSPRMTTCSYCEVKK
jgi:hypothetical protein